MLTLTQLEELARYFAAWRSIIFSVFIIIVVLSLALIFIISCIGTFFKKKG